MSALLFCSSVETADAWRVEFAAHAPDIELREYPDIGNPAEIEAALVWLPPGGMLATLPNLRLILSLGAGVDFLLADPTLPATVPIMRLVDPHMTSAMCEYVEAQVLRLHRRGALYRAQQRQRLWRPHRQPNAAERRVGILGLGALGGEVALRLEVLGFDVAGWSRGERKLSGIACFHGAAGLDPFLARTDILVCLLPLTAATAGMLNAALFAKLPKGAALINCARGEHLVEEDLLAALASGQLSAATLDVFRTEPLPQDHPFWSHEHILVTPHIAALTHPPTATPIYAEALRRLRRGELPLNLVERSRGY